MTTPTCGVVVLGNEVTHRAWHGENAPVLSSEGQDGTGVCLEAEEGTHKHDVRNSRRDLGCSVRPREGCLLAGAGL